ncbi:arylmalonate decarboxylase [Streptomyces sp. SID161]|uniref:maleate cis-trans isomerase family protein n=1 Tax=Streptomyces sp. SID161 TaxID=2690251 RepID=UPI00136BCB5A|nr:arylmalonate decarboxylase [Streptomyces sp. SID161]MYW47345.1 arylmalonate decarboxylase [Streptomyces sp. SID161]
MDLLSLPRLGLVVPPENPTAEPEFATLLDHRVNVYTARFPTTPGIGLRDMLESYNRVLPETLGQFGGMRLDGAVVACSASHYLLGPDGDRAFCAELSARAGFPVTSSTQAVLAACDALGVRRLTLVSPYEPWLTDTSRAFWERAGLVVEGTVSVPARPAPGAAPHYDPYQVTTAEILDRTAAAGLPAGTAVMFTGTGMGTLAALRELARREPGRVLLTSNLAAAWWARRALAGGAGAGAGAHPLLARLETAAGDGGGVTAAV